MADQAPHDAGILETSKRPLQIVDNVPCGEIRPSQVHGMGLFASRDIAIHEHLGTLDGRVISGEELAEIERNLSNHATHKRAVIVLEWNALPENRYLVRRKRTKYSYINHSRTPNVRLESFPPQIVALRDIPAGEELLLDYREEPLSEDYLRGHGSTYL